MLDTPLLFDIAYVWFVDSDLFYSLFDLLLVLLDSLLFCFSLHYRDVSFARFSPSLGCTSILVLLRFLM